MVFRQSLSHRHIQRVTVLQCDQIKSPNFYKSCPNMISIEKWIILAPLRKLANNHTLLMWQRLILPINCCQLFVQHFQSNIPRYLPTQYNPQQRKPNDFKSLVDLSCVEYLDRSAWRHLLKFTQISIVIDHHQQQQQHQQEKTVCLFTLATIVQRMRLTNQLMQNDAQRWGRRRRRRRWEK